MRRERVEIRWRGELLALVIPADAPAPAGTFLTPPEAPLQVGLVDGPRTVARHRHRPAERRLEGTAELAVVQRGRLEVEVFSPEGELLARLELEAGDAVAFYGGGHGFRLDPGARLLVVKQGPHGGDDEKEPF